MRNFRLVNERVYAEKNPARRQKDNYDLLNAQFGFLEGLAHEKEENAEVVDLYNQFVFNLCAFIKNANIGNTDLERAMFFQYLLNNDYLSAIQKSDTPHFSYMIGANALLCNPNAVNVAKLYYDTFKSEYSYPLEYPCYKSNKSNSFGAKKASINYAVNIVFYANALYGYDTTRNTFYLCNGPFEMRSMEQESTRFLRYKPFFEIISKPDTVHSLSDIDIYLDLFSHYSNHYVYIDPIEISRIYQNVYNRIDDNYQILDNFKEQTHEAISLMQEKMLSKK